MEGELIILDTSILKDYFIKKNKRSTDFVKLNRKGFKFALSPISIFEIEIGNRANQENFLESNGLQINDLE